MKVLSKKKRALVILGPTASGKSDFAIKLAKKFNGYLISADSRQLYKGMDIGTNKDKGVWEANKLFVDGIEEYMVDMINPDEKFSVGEWREKVEKIIESKKNQLPIIVGGTGLYISALVNNYNLPGAYDEKLRTKLEKLVENKGLAALLNKIKKIDPEIENKIDIKNPRRVIRAAEICLTTKQPFNPEQLESNYEFLQIGVDKPRGELYEKINKRVDQMMNEGLIEEVRKLLDAGYGRDLPAMSGIGYRQIIKFIDKEISKSEAVELIKRDTRRYAKRQMTWFRRDNRINWIKDWETAETLVAEFLHNRR